jgi:hypothetical protein
VKKIRIGLAKDRRALVRVDQLIRDGALSESDADAVISAA